MTVALGNITGDNITVPQLNILIQINVNFITVHGAMQSFYGGGLLAAVQQSTNITNYPACPPASTTYFAITVDQTSGQATGLYNTTGPPAAPANGIIIYQAVIPTTAANMESALGMTVSR